MVPIPGTKRRSIWRRTLAATAIVLGDAELDEIASALPQDAAAGNRYPQQMMGLLNG